MGRRKKIREQTPEDLREIEIIGLSKQLLDASVVSSGALNKSAYNEKTHKYRKLTLGFLNSFLRSMHIKTSIFKMTGIEDKIQKVKEVSNIRNGV